MALKFPHPSFRVGTIEDSIYSIVSTIEYLEQDGRIQYKELGPSSDGKVTNEFHIFPTNGMAPFSIYDYKFGLDPSDEDNFEKEFTFSIGGASKDAEESAKKLGFEVVSYNMEEAYRVDNNMKENEGSMNVIAKAKEALKGKENLEDYIKSLTKDVELKGQDAYADYTVDDWVEDYKSNGFASYSMKEHIKTKWQYRAGIIK